MKKVLIYALTFIILLTAYCVPCEAKTKAKTVKKHGYATAKIYHEDGDYCSMRIKTKSGKTYTVDEFICPLGAKCTLYFRGNKITKVVVTVKLD